MDLNKVKYFQVVATTLNISKASKIVHLSQPALSLQIQSLESELEIKLFERNNRGMLLTEEGKSLYERSQLLIDWEKQTEELMSDLNKPKGLISIGTYTTASSYLITPKLKDFCNQYPDINFTYDYSDTDDIISKIKNLKLDCAIISEVPDDDGIEKIPFYDNELIFVASSDRKVPSTITASQLQDIDFLSYPLKFDYCYKEVERKLGKYLNKARNVIESTSFDTLKQSLLNDLGMTFMPEYLVKNELKNKTLKKVEVKAMKLPIQFSIVTKKNRKLPTRVEVFKEYLLK